MIYNLKLTSLDHLNDIKYNLINKSFVKIQEMEYSSILKIIRTHEKLVKDLDTMINSFTIFSIGWQNKTLRNLIKIKRCFFNERQQADIVRLDKKLESLCIAFKFIVSKFVMIEDQELQDELKSIDDRLIGDLERSNTFLRDFWVIKVSIRAKIYDLAVDPLEIDETLLIIHTNSFILQFCHFLVDFVYSRFSVRDRIIYEDEDEDYLLKAIYIIKFLCNVIQNC